MPDGTKTHDVGGKSARRPGDAERLANYVGGEWRQAEGVEWLPDIDPVSGETVAEVPLSGAAQVSKAVAAARAAQPAWREVPPQQRARAVLALREELLRRREELSALVSVDMGKTLADADGEVGRGLESVESAAAIPHLLKGETLEGVAAGVDVEMVRQPVGVIAAITPFNFPAMIPLWFLPYAIACGNSFLLKPSENDPRPAALIVEAVDAVAEIPPGVVNLVHGGREAVTALLADPGIDAVSFVGRAETARMVATRCAETGKRAQALGGAKNSLVVMPDADLDVAVPAIMGSAFGAAGQRCLAGSVGVIVGAPERRAEVREALRAAAGKLRIGPGGDPATDVCPMVSSAARDRIAEAIARAQEEGAEILIDGRGDAGPAGTLLAPTIAITTDHESELAREELFGPLLTLVEVPDLDAGMEFVNGSHYGNAGAIFTRSGNAVRQYRYEAEAGMLGVNIGVPAPVAWFPFAGWKDSMAGDLHANGTDAVDFYTRKKVVTARW
ncbi:MAG TPA: CoA-acylating methylmalonate-semialdehyde dehydrogenase [Solirubrobacterales bacterium]|jgi:malonate-semialdehyde dehydrogenase (acetylating)/methylmalonate-semialdehyde dehydrogenase|nr:CoA-acylating methylmalonate-semialdehyde dehydrogenase [Solirubrobacterales bacterium]